MPNSPRPGVSLPVLILLFAGFLLGGAAASSALPPLPPGVVLDPVVAKELPATCAMLDDPEIRSRMDGLLFKLLWLCGRQDELGQVASVEAAMETAEGRFLATDAAVNNPAGDTAATGNSHTQSETAMARNGTTGTLCSGYNDSYHGITTNTGFTGFSRSTDDGQTWTDRGALGVNSGGDPAIVWRKLDGHFYFVALHTNGLGVWKSTDDCTTFTFLGMVHTGGGDDKELLAVDNNPASPNYGKLYVVWTDFSIGRIAATASSNAGVTWSAPVSISNPGDGVQGAWPTVAPNGDVYASWVRFLTNAIDIQVAKTTDGGGSWSLVAQPLSAGVAARDSAATSACGRTALKGNIRYLPSPQIEAGPNGNIHVVYSYDPDGLDTGDVIDVFYRRSTDGGASWGTELRVNDDATTRDQFFPSLAVSSVNAVSISWYDRRLDANNLMVDRYQRMSFDGGNSFTASIRLSDVSTPIFIDPNLANCYHGDYDQHVATPTHAVVQWSDDRNVQDGHNDPDVYTDRVAISTDFLVTLDPATLSVCRPNDAAYTAQVLQFQAFTENVTLSTVGLPVGLAAGFGTNPVTPPGSSVMTLTGTAALAFGSYDFTVRGTSSPSAFVHDATVNLKIFTQTPTTPALTAPADSAVDVSLLPTLSWAAATEAVSYTVEVATDVAFTNIVESATLASTSHTLTSSLASVTSYFWRVRAGNICGDGSNSSVFSFTTRAIPPILLVDDDDNVPNVRQTYEDALTALGLAYDVFDTGNSDLEPSLALLQPYRKVIWFSGHEFGGFAGPGTDGTTALQTWLDNQNGCLFMSSQDYIFDRGVTAFATNYLGVQAGTSDTGQTSVTGANVFAGLGPYTLSLPFANFTDSLTATGSAQIAFNGNLAPIALSKLTPTFQTVFFAFPFEGIPLATARQDVLQRALDFCVGPEIYEDGFETGDTSNWDLTTP